MKEYRGKLILFPINEKKLRKGEATEEERKVATQLKGTVMPIVKPVPVIESRKINDAEKKFSVFGCLRQVIIFNFFLFFWNLINIFVCFVNSRQDQMLVWLVFVLNVLRTLPIIQKILQKQLQEKMPRKQKNKLIQNVVLYLL